MLAHTPPRKRARVFVQRPPMGVGRGSRRGWRAPRFGLGAWWGLSPLAILPRQMAFAPYSLGAPVCRRRADGAPLIGVLPPSISVIAPAERRSRMNLSHWASHLPSMVLLQQRTCPKIFPRLSFLGRCLSFQAPLAVDLIVQHQHQIGAVRLPVHVTVLIPSILTRGRFGLEDRANHHSVVTPFPLE